MAQEPKMSGLKLEVDHAGDPPPPHPRLESRPFKEIPTEPIVQGGIRKKYLQISPPQKSGKE